ncbi:hypothetical protein BX616_009770 [Lobosporangium transversale]|nr:hypothetical protein BX616_009770 [Lobosporangium transversale]
MTTSGDCLQNDIPLSSTNRLSRPLLTPPERSFSPSLSPSIDIISCTASRISPCLQRTSSTLLDRNKSSFPFVSDSLKQISTISSDTNPASCVTFDDPIHEPAVSGTSSSAITPTETPKRGAQSPLPRRLHSQEHEQTHSSPNPSIRPLLGASELSSMDEFMGRHKEASQWSQSSDPRRPDMSFWQSSDDDPQELESNKRPKSESRGIVGRNARSVSWGARPRPRLQRRSTMSMIADEISKKVEIDPKNKPDLEKESESEGSGTSMPHTLTTCHNLNESILRTPIKKGRQSPQPGFTETIVDSTPGYTRACVA